MSKELPSIPHRVQSIQDWLQREDEELLYTPDLKDTQDDWTVTQRLRSASLERSLSLADMSVLAPSHFVTPDLQNDSTLTTPGNIPVWPWHAASNPDPTTFMLDNYPVELECDPHYIHRTHLPKKSLFAKLRWLWSFDAILVYINGLLFYISLYLF